MQRLDVAHNRPNRCDMVIALSPLKMRSVTGRRLVHNLGVLWRQIVAVYILGPIVPCWIALIPSDTWAWIASRLLARCGGSERPPLTSVVVYWITDSNRLSDVCLFNTQPISIGRKKGEALYFLDRNECLVFLGS